MKKQILLRGLIGALVGLLIGQFVLISISLSIGNGQLLPVPPMLEEKLGSELTAYIVQTLATMLYGCIWAAASIIWEIEHWSLTKQTVLHCLCYALSALPIAYLLNWFEHSWAGLLGYFGGFALLYAAIWLGQYLGMKQRIKKMNERLKGI